MPLELTVLGNYGAFPARGGACSGYLVRSPGATVLIDCGSGTAARMQEYVTLPQLTAVVASHLHLDHITDLTVLRYAFEIGHRDGKLNPLPVYCPATPESHRFLLETPGFRLTTIADGEAIMIGDLRITFCRGVHKFESLAMRIECGDERVVYTADTAWFPELVTFAAGADLLLAESTLLRGQRNDPPAHLTATDCVALADQAGVELLLLTHLWYETPPEAYLAEAHAARPTCQVALAEPGMTYIVSHER